MSQTFTERLGWMPKSESLRMTIARALNYAQERKHVEVTLEHLLLALIDDPSAAAILETCNINLGSLRSDVAHHISAELTDLIGLGEGDTQASEGIKKVMAHASAAAEQSQRAHIDGAIVLAALIGEGESQAARILTSFGLTFDVAVTNLKNYTPAQDKSSIEPQRPNTHAPSQPQTFEPVSTNGPSSHDDDPYSSFNIDSQTERVISNFTQSPSSKSFAETGVNFKPASTQQDQKDDSSDVGQNINRAIQSHTDRDADPDASDAYPQKIQNKPQQSPLKRSSKNKPRNSIAEQIEVFRNKNKDPNTSTTRLSKSQSSSGQPSNDQDTLTEVERQPNQQHSQQTPMGNARTDQHETLGQNETFGQNRDRQNRDHHNKTRQNKVQESEISASKDTSVEDILASVREIIGYEDEEETLDNTKDDRHENQFKPSSATTIEPFETDPLDDIDHDQSVSFQTNEDRAQLRQRPNKFTPEGAESAKQAAEERAHRDIALKKKRFSSGHHTSSQRHFSDPAIDDEGFQALSGSTTSRQEYALDTPSSAKPSVKDYMLTRPQAHPQSGASPNSQHGLEDDFSGPPKLPELDERGIPISEDFIPPLPEEFKNNKQNPTSQLQKILANEPEATNKELHAEARHQGTKPSSGSSLNQSDLTPAQKLDVATATHQKPAPQAGVKSKAQPKAARKTKKQTIRGQQQSPYLISLPKSMRRAEETTVEIEITREDIDTIQKELIGNTQIPPNDILTTHAMTLQLSAPEAGVVIQPLSPPMVNTQPEQGKAQAEKFVWSWSITSLKKGKHPVHLTISSRIIGDRGLFPNDTLPEQIGYIKVKGTWKGFLKTLMLLAFGGLIGAAAMFILSTLGYFP